MKIKNISILLLTAALFGFTACSEDEGIRSESIFDSVETPEKTEFDNWLETNYRQPNIAIVIRSLTVPTT